LTSIKALLAERRGQIRQRTFSFSVQYAIYFHRFQNQENAVISRAAFPLMYAAADAKTVPATVTLKSK
jgi:hypothetical protein